MEWSSSRATRDRELARAKPTSTSNDALVSTLYIPATILSRPDGFSPDGTKLAYSRGRLVANVWRVPILEDRLATWADAEKLTYEQAFVE